jgi:hypothetical protein
LPSFHTRTRRAFQPSARVSAFAVARCAVVTVRLTGRTGCPVTVGASGLRFAVRFWLGRPVAGGRPVTARPPSGSVLD